MKLIQGHYENTIVIQKSKFIAEAFRVNTIEEIEEILAQIRKKYYDASHHCFAYQLPNHVVKMSDDGEPSKTAGAPILDVILKKDISNILVVVTRYFGGILLGAGGLVRAYSGATSAVLDKADFYIQKTQSTFQMTCSYSDYQTILKALKYISIEKTSFLSEVVLLAHCEQEKYQQLEKDLYAYKLKDTKIQYLGLSTIELLINT